MKGPSNMFYVYVGIGSSTRTTFSSFGFHFAMYAFKLLHNGQGATYRLSSG